MRNEFIFVSISLVVSILLGSLVYPAVLWAFLLIVPLLAVGFYDYFQTHSTLKRNFPLLARGRWLAETLRPPVRQYFIEGDLEGTPISRMFRSVVYQRSKKALDTVPFGTQSDVSGRL